MKAETNETHCLYRGQCFVWFGRTRYTPETRDDERTLGKH